MRTANLIRLAQPIRWCWNARWGPGMTERLVNVRMEPREGWFLEGGGGGETDGETADAWRSSLVVFASAGREHEGWRCGLLAFMSAGSPPKMSPSPDETRRWGGDWQATA